MNIINNLFNYLSNFNKNNNKAYLPEIIFEIFSYLSINELAQASLVCRQWRLLAQDMMPKRIIKEMTLVKREDWKKFFGDVEEEPKITLETTLKLKKYFKTHQLIFIPQTINGKELNLNLLVTILPNSFLRFDCFYNDIVQSAFGMIPLKKSYWALIAKQDVGYRLSYEDQKILISEKDSEMRLSTVVETVIFLTFRFFKTGSWSIVYSARCFEQLQQQSVCVTIAQGMHIAKVSQSATLEKVLATTTIN